MTIDNWVGRTRTFDRDDPSFWGGFPSIPAFIGRCSPLTKLKMTASSIQRDWYFTSFTPFCSIWRDLYGGHLCIYKGNKSATQNMMKWLSTIGFFFYTSLQGWGWSNLWKVLLSGRNDMSINSCIFIHFLKDIWSIYLLGSKKVKHFSLFKIKDVKCS